MDNIVLATATDVKLFLEQETTTFDDLINLMLVGVSSKIEKFLNRNLLKTERTEYFDAGVKKIFLSSFPVDMDSDFTVEDCGNELTINSDYYVWEDSGIVEFNYLINKVLPKQISVTYTGGFDLLSTVTIRSKTYNVLDVPEAIVLATVKQVAYEFLRRKELGITSYSTQEGNLSVSNYELLPEVKFALLPFRRNLSW